MGYKELREHKPLVVDINSRGHADPRFHGVTTQVPVKEVKNLRSDMAVQELYTKGPLKWENTGKTCGECMSYYPDPNLGPKKGRCKSRGFMRTEEYRPANARKEWQDPESGMVFKPFPECPYFVERSRMSRR